MVAACEASHDF
ncbi:hypothetical protein TIFTF001_044341 [Ficus carica]|uniref:Uncharacterized protein n=1 Tax=Ficus carica TaxID=3494 RepID=A0AA88CTN2_FICCA|nr:hypothetical protein TIFTF001_044341 [Ficus carica]